MALSRVLFNLKPNWIDAIIWLEPIKAKRRLKFVILGLRIAKHVFG